MFPVFVPHLLAILKGKYLQVVCFFKDKMNCCLMCVGMFYIVSVLLPVLLSCGSHAKAVQNCDE